jgi:hypothetical protein
MVPKTNAVPLGGRKEKIEQFVERLPEDAYSEEVVPARDSGEKRPWEWACLELAADPEKGMGRWLLVRRSSDDPDDLSFYQTYGPEDTSVEELVRVCQDRWAIEIAFEEAKGEKSGWTITKYAGGKPGTATSHCACWRTLSWSSPASLPVTKKLARRPVKKGS